MRTSRVEIFAAFLLLSSILWWGVSHTARARIMELRIDQAEHKISTVPATKNDLAAALKVSLDKQQVVINRVSEGNRLLKNDMKQRTILENKIAHVEKHIERIAKQK